MRYLEHYGRLPSTIGGNTNLIGGLIESSTGATNSLTTGSLTASSLTNTSKDKATSFSLSLGTSAAMGSGGAAAINNSQSSTTQSGISSANVTVGGATQTGALANVNSGVTTGVDSSNALTQSWNGTQLQSQVNAQTAIASTFGQQASTTIGSISDKLALSTQEKAAQAQQAANSLQDDADAGNVSQAVADAAQAYADQAQQQADKWSEGGLDRTLLHTLAGGLNGGLGGALGALASSEATPRINALLLDTDKPSGLAYLLAGVTAAGIGYAAGGISGAGAATNQIYNNDFVDFETRKVIRAKCAAGTTSAAGLPCAAGVVNYFVKNVQDPTTGEIEDAVYFKPFYPPGYNPDSTVEVSVPVYDQNGAAGSVPTKTAPATPASTSSQQQATENTDSAPSFFRAPDFLSGNLNVAIPTPWTCTLVGVTFALNVDRDGGVYFGLGPSVGKSATLVSGSATADWVDQKITPTAQQLNGFLTQHSFTATAGFWGGVQQTYTPGSGWATGVGFVSPQVGGGYTYSKHLFDTKFTW